MPESSVDAYINAQPPEEQNLLSFDDWMRETHPNSTAAMDKFGGYDAPVSAFWTWFTGDRKRWNREYDTYKENYLANLQMKNEYLATQSANAFSKMMDDTKIQRAMKDYENAGLNPYLLVNGGSIGSGSVPTTSKADYFSSKSDRNKKDDSRNKALILLALAKIAASLL